MLVPVAVDQGPNCVRGRGWPACPHGSVRLYFLPHEASLIDRAPFEHGFDERAAAQHITRVDEPVVH